jgi:hypothetical protein
VVSVEYWLIDSDSGNAQGCYLSLADALQAAELELEGQAIESLSLLGMRSHKREPKSERSPEPRHRLFVRFDLDITRGAVTP